MINDALKKFAIVKFDVISTYGTNPYKVVPFKWVKDTDKNKVLAQYPSKDDVFKEFENILKCNEPKSRWIECSGSLEYLTNSYLDGLIFIKTRRNEFIPEELMFLDYTERFYIQNDW
ncbi:GSCOCT00014200001.2-RA-CDS [Cotesia congregata]|uniref:Cc_bv9.6_28.18 n=2 Tax=root TaxID=1 RepID=S6D4S8_COTCN|nr:GSCOCT00014200001.2-RA-CDS [Cotesia congregata]CAG5092496.1 cc_bv9.6_28.18 [Cotesia congregata]CCB96394.1 hypothetical protein BV9-6 [Bracoviriform congregatae]CCQ71220.1 hypothetical protein BV9-6 [Cotesia congregata]